MLLFWAISAISIKGVEATTTISAICSIGGTLLPMAIIITLAIAFLAGGNQPAVPITWGNMFPDINLDTLGYFQSIIFSLLGIEVVAIHRKDVVNPKKTYPSALNVASILIFLSLTFSSTAICVVTKTGDVSAITGLLDAFAHFFEHYNMSWAKYIMGVAMMLGTLGVSSSWIIGLTRGLYVMVKDMNIFPWLIVKNQHDIPYRILFIQAILYSLLASLFILSPSIKDSYWLLSTLTSQFNLFYYLILFGAVMKLRKRRLNFTTYWEAFTNYVGPVTAIITCVFAIVLAYFPTSQVTNVWIFEIELISGQILFSIPGILIFFLDNKKETPKDGSQKEDEITKT